MRIFIIKGFLMSAQSKEILGWLKQNALQLCVFLGMIANLYFVNNFVTKPEYDKHSAAEAEVHKSLNENLQALSKAVIRLEFIANTAEETARQVREQAIRLAGLEERLKSIERQLQTVSK
jgi:hypothetical protein